MIDLRKLSIEIIVVSIISIFIGEIVERITEVSLATG